jgi:hypothetical protein
MAMLQITLNAIVEESLVAAKAAASDYHTKHHGGVERGACGFAWVEICEYEGKRITGNTKLGRMFKQMGITQDYTRTFQIWNPSKFPTQSIDVLEAGARAAANVFNGHGFKAYAGSRLD